MRSLIASLLALVGACSLATASGSGAKVAGLGARGSGPNGRLNNIPRMGYYGGIRTEGVVGE